MAESYINHRGVCWQEDRYDKRYNLKIEEERESYYSKICKSCRIGEHKCKDKACICPIHMCSPEDRANHYKFRIDQIFKYKLRKNT